MSEPTMTALELQVAIESCPDCRPGVPCPSHALDLEALERASCTCPRECARHGRPVA